MSTELFNQIYDMAVKPHTEMYGLNSIFLEKPITVNGSSIRRITPNMNVCIKDGQLSNGKETHTIQSLRGTLSNSRFEITAKDLKTKEITIINF